jgi:hypothetical protein
MILLNFAEGLNYTIELLKEAAIFVGDGFSF